MEEHALIAVGDAEQSSDFGRVEPFDVSEHDDLPLLVRECRQQIMDLMGEVLGDEPVVNLVGPGHGRRGPRAVGAKAFDSLTISTAGPLLTIRAGASTVDQHPKQPSLERRPALEALHAADDGEPGLLARLLRDGATAHCRLGEAEQPRLVTADQLDERRLVAGAQPFDEPEVVIHSDRGYKGLVASTGCVEKRRRRVPAYKRGHGASGAAAL